VECRALIVILDRASLPARALHFRLQCRHVVAQAQTFPIWLRALANWAAVNRIPQESGHKL